MKKLYYSLIILLVVFVGLVMPKVEAAGDFDDDAHCIGYIEYYERDDEDQITGAWVYIVDSSVLLDQRYFWFNPTYFQPDILEMQDELLGKTLIWNPLDDLGEGAYNGRWWLLIGFEYVFDDIADAYQAGYESGYNDGRSYGYGIGYQDGYGAGQAYGFDQGYAVGSQLGYNDGYEFGYGNGFADGREQVLDSIENMEILYQDVILPNGVKDEIVDNEILNDRVGVEVFDGFEDEEWKRYNFDVEPYTTVAFILNFSGYAFNEEQTHFISNILNKGSVWNTDVANRIYLSPGGSVQVRLAKLDLVAYGYDEGMSDAQKVNVFKSWLKAQKDAGEPLMIWYQYAEPEQYDLVSLLRNEDGSYADGYLFGYNQGRVHVQRENKSLLSVIPTAIGSVWLMISDFLSYEVFGLNLWAILMMFASFSLLILIIKMVI